MECPYLGNCEKRLMALNVADQNKKRDQNETCLYYAEFCSWFHIGARDADAEACLDD